MPQCFDESGPVYVVSPKGFMTVLRNVEINLPGPGVTVDEPGPRIPTRQLIFVRGERSRATVTEIHALAIAVLQGDTGAALLLADLVQEQHTGSRSELRAEIKKRVDEAGRVAVEKERARCHAQARRFFDYLSMDPALASDSPTGRACLQIVNNIRTGQ